MIYWHLLKKCRAVLCGKMRFYRGRHLTFASRVTSMFCRCCKGNLHKDCERHPNIGQDPTVHRTRRSAARVFKVQDNLVPPTSLAAVIWGTPIVSTITT